METFNFSSSRLFENSYTKLDAVRFLEKLQNISDALFNIKIPLDMVLDHLLSINEKAYLIEHCEKFNINLADPIAFQKHVRFLKEGLEKEQVITMYVSINPTTEMVKQISDWFVKSFNHKYFLDIQTKPEIIGGLILVINGTYKDYSLKRLLEEKYGKKEILNSQENKPLLNHPLARGQATL
jgi:hypothetical protein